MPYDVHRGRRLDPGPVPLAPDLALRTYPSRAVLIAGAVPHALALFGMPVFYSLAAGKIDLLPLSMVVIGAILYIAHLLAGAQQSGEAMNELRKTTQDANEAWRPVGAEAFLTKPIDPELLVETLLTVSRPVADADGRSVA